MEGHSPGMQLSQQLAATLLQAVRLVQLHAGPWKSVPPASARSRADDRIKIECLAVAGKTSIRAA